MIHYDLCNWTNDKYCCIFSAPVSNHMTGGDGKYSYPPSPLKLPVTDKAMSCTSSFELPGAKLHHPSPSAAYPQAMTGYPSTEASFPHGYNTAGTTPSSAFSMKQNGEYSTDAYSGYSSAVQGFKGQVTSMPANVVTGVPGQQPLGSSWPFYGLSGRPMSSPVAPSDRSGVKQEVTSHSPPSHHPLLSSFSPKSAWLPSSSDIPATSYSYSSAQVGSTNYATAGFASAGNPYR